MQNDKLEVAGLKLKYKELRGKIVILEKRCLRESVLEVGLLTFISFMFLFILEFSHRIVRRAATNKIRQLFCSP